jgi:membrane protease YdiL (CAAX protease family)
LHIGLIALAVLPLFAASSARRRAALPALLWLVLIAIADDLLLSLPSGVPALRVPGLDYNWTGKVFSLALGLACIYWLRVVTPLDAGWTLKQQPGSVRPAALVVAGVIAIELPIFWLLIPPEQATLEDHVFQLTMPGVSEELMYRGVLLALADRVARPTWNVCGAVVGWGAVATSVLFAADHAVSLDSSWSLHINWLAGLLPLLGGFVFVWLRARTGSLLWPIMLHGLANELAVIVAAIKL